MTTERDPRTRLVLSWLREDMHENAERVLLRALDEVDTTPQRRSWWPAWRGFRMNKLAVTAAAAAAVLLTAVVGYNLLPGPGIVGPGAAPSLLARGTVVHRDWGPIEFEATREGPSVTGRMTVGPDEEPLSDPLGFVRVDLQCARTTEDGLIMIGGYITDGAGDRFTGWPAGHLRRARPQARVTRAHEGLVGNVPGTETTDCMAYLDALANVGARHLPGVGLDRWSHRAWSVASTSQ